MQPTVFYRWQKEFFENGAAAFEQKKPSNHSADQERIAYLEKKIQTKDEVLAELTTKDMLAGRQQEIHAERDRKLATARRQTADSSPRGRLNYR